MPVPAPHERKQLQTRWKQFNWKRNGSNDECYPHTGTSRLLIANYFRQTILTTKQVFSNKPSANRWVTNDYDSVAYAETFHGGGFIQRHRVVICIWCALFVTSQNDVIALFPNQRFGEVCWHNMHIFLYIHSYFMCQCTEYKLLELQVRLSEENTYTKRYDTALRNCKKYQAAR